MIDLQALRSKPIAHSAESNGVEEKPAACDLRKVLTELGDRLVQEHGFQPANLYGCSALLNHTLEPLVRFLVWLEHTPEAAFVLQHMGVWRPDPLRAELRRLNGQTQERNTNERGKREPRHSRS
jgi:hypothetical protein